MRYAISNGQRAEPQPKTRGTCPGCGGEVTAKCGKHVLWHWAHLASTHCDQWWEPETEWHRTWKNRFPADWQEIPLRSSSTGELHIADVRTPHGLVIEFQRSTIDSEEVAAREAFYQKMIWVIDGTRSENDVAYFRLGISSPDKNGIAGFSWFGRSKLFHRWMSHKPVFIDFGPTLHFWRVVRFDPQTKNGTVIIVDRKAFAELAASGTTDFSSGGGPATR